MKLNINFLQTGGVPLTNDLMGNIMEAIKFYDVLGDIAGSMTIVSGCDFVAGSTTVVNPGIVAINGELLPFEGGTVFPKLFIHTEELTETFEDQTNKVLVIKKTVKFGDSPTFYNWTDFLKLQTLREMKISLDGKASQTQVDDHETRIELLELKTAPIVNGGIVWIWNLPVADIPDGWKECTDLRGKTVFGRDPNNPQFLNLGTSVGASSVNIQKTNLPNITIGYEDVEPGNPDWGGGGYDGGNTKFRRAQKQTAPLGSGTPLNILNPGRIVNFIEPNFQ
ncbi:hypothetical protein [Chryseobacterium sp.]|uniref:hypothetical protein n=1 Tax=Chryseobacterium sp. TaxID=1871047 RepID=UPI002898F347|nr:hypothetical protein [Chryseobacterium sp.]